jgi:hypothetical protein
MDQLSPGALLQVARRWLTDGGYNLSSAHVTKVLESASAAVVAVENDSDVEESRWLLDKLRAGSGGSIPEFGRSASG